MQKYTTQHPKHTLTDTSPYYHTCTQTDTYTEDKPVKYVVYLFPDVGSESKKLSIYSVQDCFEEVSFTRIFTVKQL